MDHNSNKNQDIKGKLIGREVYCNVNTLVQENKGMEDGTLWDEVENLYCYDYSKKVLGETIEVTNEKEKAEALDKLDDLAINSNEMCSKDEISEFTNEKNFEQIENARSEINDLEQEQQEVLEWWAVSNWFFEKLKEKGQPVIEFGNTCVWGRCTSGQAILLDNVISEIAEGMEILEGQANEWNK